MVRDVEKFSPLDAVKEKVSICQGDFEKGAYASLPDRVDVAIFLVHGMCDTRGNLIEREERLAHNFVALCRRLEVKQILFLTGIVDDARVSTHLRSRRGVEEVLRASGIPFTILCSGIVMGASSASFEVMRDLTEKLALMLTPKWVRQKCQPISIVDVIYYITHACNDPRCYNRIFDIGGPDVLTYKEMLLRLAEFRGLKRHIWTVPLLTPRLSALWLCFVTKVNFRLARYLVESMEVDVVCRENSIQDVFDHRCLNYEESLQRIFHTFEQSDRECCLEVADRSCTFKSAYTPQCPTIASYKIVARRSYKGTRENLIDEVFKIGGSEGYPFLNWVWQLRGLWDRLFGKSPLRRIRRDHLDLEVGDVLDFWRVIFVDRERGQLLLFSEMHLPGNGWLSFHVTQEELVLQAVFRPRGVTGRLYWILTYPMHKFLFWGLTRYYANFQA